MRTCKVKDYKVVTEGTPDELEAKVKQLLSAKWELWGTVVINTPIVDGGVAPIWTQVMVQSDFMGESSPEK